MTHENTFSLENDIESRLASRNILLMAHMVVGYHPEQDSDGFTPVAGPSLKDEAIDVNRRMMQLMKEADVDLVELQMPFSEPIADGPSFIAANHGAIANGITSDDYFGVMREFSALGIPLMSMGYYNWPYRLGHDKFARRLSDAGGRGYIMADLPPEIDAPLRRECEQYGLAPILVATPTNTRVRLEEISRGSRGFLYCQARRGVTGRETAIDSGTVEFLNRCKDAASEDLPLGVGFGIDTADKVRALKGKAAIAIVGTALLKAWQRGGEEGFRDTLLRLSEARW